MKTLDPGVARVLKRLHYPLEVILTSVRWCVAYPLSLRHLEEMIAERGIAVDHSTVHRWAIKPVPVEQRWPHSFGQDPRVFKWNRCGNQAADFIAGSVAKYASSGV